jgi:nitrite reductase (cytochrome c-552)
MPYERDGAAKFSDHDVKSPLVEPGAVCGQCHSNVDYVVKRVEAIQDQVHSTMMNCEKALVSAINEIAVASKAANVNQDKLASARDLHRRAQLRWDFIAAENSMGFHNPEEALRILAEATDMARQAQITAMEAVK